MRPAEADCRRLRDCPAARSQGARATLRCSTGGYADSCTVPKAWKKMVVAAMAVQAVGVGQTRLRRIAAHLAGARSEVAAAGFEEAPRGPLSDEQIDQFDRDGFLNSGEHLLTEAEVTELSDHECDPVRPCLDFTCSWFMCPASRPTRQFGQDATATGPAKPHYETV